MFAGGSVLWFLFGGYPGVQLQPSGLLGVMLSAILYTLVDIGSRITTSCDQKP